MEMRQLHQFVAVVEHRSFSRAADALGISQQALSYGIANLEKELGVRLFDRGQFGAELTPVGETLARRVRLVAAELELARAEVEAMRGGARGHVNLGVSEVIGERILPAAIQTFAAQRPDVSVRVVVSHSQVLFEALLLGELDFALTTPLEPIDRYAELRHEPVGRAFKADANYVAMRVGHPLLRKGKPPLSKFREYPWIVPASFSTFQNRLIEIFHDASLPPPAYMLRLDSINVCKALLRQSDFVCLLGREQTAHEEELGVLRGLPFPGLESIALAYFSYRKRFPLQAPALALLETLKKQMQRQGGL